MFEFINVSARYGPLEALKAVNLTFKEKEMAAVLGHNGAGKTTLLRCGVGEHSEISGTVKFNGENIVPGQVHRNVKKGIGFVPQEQNVFGELEVEENLKIAGMRAESFLGEVYELFPRLKERKRQLARSLSGGERQMLAVGMALMARPRMLLLDEPTTGLSPLLVSNVIKTLKTINEALSISIILVEQNVQAVLEAVERVTILHMGRIAFDGPAGEVRAHHDLWSLF
ncbi:MAG: ABC transporter ATP-binding protein [Thermodesulfobacteriota bacterium]